MKRVVHYANHGKRFRFPCCQEEMNRWRASFKDDCTQADMKLWPKTTTSLHRVTCLECWRHIKTMADMRLKRKRGWR